MSHDNQSLHSSFGRESVSADFEQKQTYDSAPSGCEDLPSGWIIPVSSPEEEKVAVVTSASRTASLLKNAVRWIDGLDDYFTEAKMKSNDILHAMEEGRTEWYNCEAYLIELRVKMQEVAEAKEICEKDYEAKISSITADFEKSKSAMKEQIEALDVRIAEIDAEGKALLKKSVEAKKDFDLPVKNVGCTKVETMGDLGDCIVAKHGFVHKFCNSKSAETKSLKRDILLFLTNLEVVLDQREGISANLRSLTDEYKSAVVEAGLEREKLLAMHERDHEELVKLFKLAERDSGRTWTGQMGLIDEMDRVIK